MEGKGGRWSKQSSNVYISILKKKILCVYRESGLLIIFPYSHP